MGIFSASKSRNLKWVRKSKLWGFHWKVMQQTPGLVPQQKLLSGTKCQLMFSSWLWRYEAITNTTLPLINTASSELTAFQNKLHSATKAWGTKQAHLLSLLATPSLSGPRAPQLTGALENPFCHMVRNFCSHSKHQACCAPNKVVFKTRVGMCIYVKWLNGPTGW